MPGAFCYRSISNRSPFRFTSGFSTFWTSTPAQNPEIPVSAAGLFRRGWGRAAAARGEAGCGVATMDHRRPLQGRGHGVIPHARSIDQIKLMGLAQNSGRDRRRRGAAGHMVGKRAIVIPPQPDPNRDLRGHADKPGVSPILSGSGFASNADRVILEG